MMCVLVAAVAGARGTNTTARARASVCVLSGAQHPVPFGSYVSLVGSTVTNVRSSVELHWLHACENPRCCNLLHLLLGSPRDNQLGARHGVLQYRDCVRHQYRGLAGGIATTPALLTLADLEAALLAFCMEHGPLAEVLDAAAPGGAGGGGQHGGGAAAPGASAGPSGSSQDGGGESLGLAGRERSSARARRPFLATRPHTQTSAVAHRAGEPFRASQRIRLCSTRPLRQLGCSAPDSRLGAAAPELPSRASRLAHSPRRS
jgi:hypothetical protein